MLRSLLPLCHLLAGAAAAAAGTTWRCSTDGSEWEDRRVTTSASDDQQRVVAEAGGMASAGDRTVEQQPLNLCTQIERMNCNGNDISRPYGGTAAECCAKCKALQGCYAWTFDSTPVHQPQCNMKSRCDNTTGTKWVVSGFSPAPPAPPPPPPPGTLFKLSIRSSDALQQMEGFGGCFNEKGWDALSVLTESARTEVMEAMFGEDGLRWNINRMPVGSSDFADSYYSLDDTIDDFSIAHLNLTRDNTKLLPFIQAAMKINPNLRIWGSPWSGPTWMKDSSPQIPKNEGCGSLSPDPRMRAAYALYLAKAAKAYRAAGLNFEHLAIQNEPNQGDTWNGKSCRDSYPKMHWTGDQLHTFLRDYLGPTFAKQGISDTVGLFLATFPVNDYASYVEPALTDPEALKYLSGVGLQYAGVGMISSIKAVKPTLKIWETETPCGSGRHNVCGNGPGTKNNSWAWGMGQWSTMRAYIESGVSVYSQWNMVLDQTGQSGWGWAQCSPITVDSTHKQVTYEGSYWATKHFSYYVDVNATVLPVMGSGNDQCVSVNGACGCARGCSRGDPTTEFIAFRNPSGETVVLAQNRAAIEQPVEMTIDGKLAFSEKLPAASINTFVVPKLNIL